jgi:hypothetical protein
MAAKKDGEKKLKQVLEAFLKVKPMPRKPTKTAAPKAKGS